MLEISKTHFESLKETNDYYKYFESLKQKILFFIHLNYTDEEILQLIRELKLPNVVISDIIPTYIENVRKRNRGVYVNELDKNVLLEMWYERFLDFGKRGEYNHYSDLLVFQFQIDEIKSLLNEFEVYVKGEVKQIVDKILLNLYINKYKGFKTLLSEYYKMFGVKIVLAKIPNLANNNKIGGVPKVRLIMDFKFPENENFQDFFGQKKNRPIVKFISRLRLIILGGQKSKYSDRYIPFFMDKKATVENVKSYMNTRLNSIIKTYYPRYLRRKKIPATLKDSQLIETALNLPVINLTAFNYIDWDFMPEQYFYDGVCVQVPLKKSSIYTIQTHPFNLFLCYFFKNEFEIFLDQLLHHEFIHLLQYRVVYIYDNLLSSDKFRRENPQGYKLLFNLTSTHWINELKTLQNPKGYDPKISKSMASHLDSQNGWHSWRFIQEVNKFKNCRRAMTIRGRVETIYSAMYYLLYAANLGGTGWFLCNPKPEEPLKTSIIIEGEEEQKISKIGKQTQPKLMKIRILDPSPEKWYSIKERNESYYIAKEGSKGSIKFVYFDIGDIEEPGIQGIAFLRGVKKDLKLKVGNKVRTNHWKSQAIRIEYKAIRSNALEDPEIQISKALKKYHKTIIDFLDSEYKELAEIKILPKNKDFFIELYGQRIKLKSKELIRLNP
ncbi:MAG: hypothetical protein ACFFDB_00315 [Promethearchaeota archaeon]